MFGNLGKTSMKMLGLSGLRETTSGVWYCNVFASSEIFASVAVAVNARWPELGKIHVISPSCLNAGLNSSSLKRNKSCFTS